MNKNTIYNIQAIDAYAFEQTILHKTYHKAWFKYNPMDTITDKATGKPTHLVIQIRRTAMDGVGYIVGEETYTARFPLFNKSKFNLYGIPHSLSNKVIIPNADYNIEVEPAMEIECQCNEDDECNCYYPPDEDFAYQEIDSVIQYCIENLIEADYNPETRVWTLGDYEWSVENDTTQIKR